MAANTKGVKLIDNTWVNYQPTGLISVRVEKSRVEQGRVEQRMENQRTSANATICIYSTASLIHQQRKHMKL